jgi:hypothetical protein
MLRQRGDWGALQASCQNLLGRLGFEAPLELDRDYVRLVLVRPGVSGDNELVSIVTHPGLPASSSETLPGIHEGSTNKDQPKLFECLITDNPHATIASDYTYKQTPNELLDKIASFMKENVDLGAFVGTEAAHEKPERDVHYLHAMLKQIQMPYARAEIGIKSAVSLPPKGMNEVRAAIDKAKANALLRFARAGTTPCAAALTESMAIELEGVPYTNTTSEDDFQVSVDGAIKVALKKADTLPACKSAALVDWTNALRIEDYYRDALKSETVEGDWTITNTPFERWGLGVTSAIPLAGGGDQVKIDGGKIVADPLSGVLAIAGVDWHPWPYRPELIRPSWQERLKLSTGVVFVPDLGVTLAVGYMPFPVRGFTFNVGGGVLRMRELRPGYSLSSSSLSTTDEADTATHYVWGGIFFAGVEYSF